MSSRYPPVRPAIGRPLATRAFARRTIKRHSATWVEEPSAELAPQRTDGEARTGDRTLQEARRTATEGEFREPVNRQALGAVVGAAAQQDETNNTADAQPVLPVEAPPSMPFSVAQVRAALQRPASFESPQVARRQTDSGQPAPLDASTRAARPSQSPRASRPLPAQEPAPARRTSSQLVELGPADSQVVPKRPRDEPLRAADSLRVESRVDEGPEVETRRVEDKLTSAVQDEPAPPSGTPEAPVRRDLVEPPTDQGLLRRHKATPGEAPEVTAGQIRKALELGALGPNQLKTQTRCGMGPCQARMCGLTISEIIADYRKEDISRVGYLRIRPPIKPITVEQLSDLELVD